MSEPPSRFRLRDSLFFSFSSLHTLIQHRKVAELVSKAYKLWRRAGIAGVWRRLWWIGYETLGYARWIKQFDTFDDADRQAILEHVGRLRIRPRISVLMPTYNSPERWLRQAIESVRNQLYPDWELCIADDASPQPHVRAILEEYQRLDERIRVIFREHNGHISVASNSALSLCHGEFVVLLDHDDELPPHALYMVAAILNEKPFLDIIYSDEDKIDEYGRRSSPYFKPDWNPDLFTAQNLLSHLGVYRTSLVREAGGFREGYEGSQDWDLALRISERIPPSHIHHIPQVLYHWRSIPGSAAIGPNEKSYVAQASLSVVQGYLQRHGYAAIAEPAFGSFVRVRYTLPNPAPLVSILLACDVTTTNEFILRTRYPSMEVLARNCEEQNGSIPVRRVDGGKSSAEWFNIAANAAHGEILCLLDSDCLPQGIDWLEELVSHAWRNEIGVAGPLVLDAEGNIRNAQTVLCNDPVNDTVAWSYYSGFAEGEKGQRGRAALLQNLTVLPPGCLVVRTSTFRKIGGLDAETFSTSPLCGFDLCLHLIEEGYHNLWSPYARLTISSDFQTANHPEENRLFRERWKNYLDRDPAHNPNLACGIEWPFPAFPPRIGKPWRKA